MKRHIGRNILVYLLIFAAILCIAFFFTSGGSEPKEVKYSKFVSMLEDKEFTSVTLNDDEYIVPIFTDEREYILGMQYFSLNVMDDNKEYIIEKLDYFKKLKEDPKFLGYLVNISSVSYIINTSLL